MKDNNERDEFRFEKLYQLLGEEVNAVYEDDLSNSSIPQNEAINDSSEQQFNDIFNIFNTEDNKPNTEAFMNAVNKQNNNEYIQELNDLMNNYTEEANKGTESSNFNEELFFNESANIFNPTYWNETINNNIPVDEDKTNSNLENVAERNNWDIPTEEEQSIEKENIPDLASEFSNEDNEEIKTKKDIDNFHEEELKDLVDEGEIDTKELSTEDSEVPEEPKKEIFNKELFIEPTKIEIDNKITKKEKAISNEYNINNKNKVRNKTLIPSKNIYDDGLDSRDDKRTIMDVLSSRKTIHILLVIIFIIMLILVVKAFYFGKLVDIYNEYTTETSKEYDKSTKIYDDELVDIETLKKAAASELIDCISSPIDTNKLSNELNSTIKEISNYYRTNGKYYAFAYKDLFTGFTVSYNENGNIFAASTIKAPVNIYLYEMASQGKINLDDELTYTANYYNNGTGVLKNKNVNTKYNIRTLSEYAIRNSDNAAHNMLMDKYGRNNIKMFWSDKGTNIILTGNDNWGLINAHDAMIYMKELYTFYVNNDDYGNELMNNFVNAKTKFITGKNNYKVANKTGWSGTSQHDAAIVFADNPYIVIALSNLGYDNNYMNHFNKVNDLASKLHNEYWKYKMNMCNNIKQHD